MRSFALGHLKRGGALVVDESTSHFSELKDYPHQLFKVPFNLDSVLNNYDAIQKNFTIDQITVQEIVSTVSKSKVRCAVAEAIKSAFWFQNLPFAHLWYYPQGYRSLFSFRFDMDEYDPLDHKNFLNLLKEAKGSVSCFVCMKTYENFPEAIDEVVDTGVEVASHSYVHHVYHNAPQNKWNLEKALKILQPKTGLIEGFSAPHGKWHATLQQTLEEGGYQYSSEFSLDYDNFPFFPYYDGKFSQVLQIPTHPICEGVFLERYNFDIKMFQNYYSSVIQYKLNHREPILFFGHPTKRLGRYPQIFRFIYDSVKNNPRVWLVEYRQLASWWKKRHETSLSLEWKNDNIHISNLADGLEVHVLYPNNSEAWLKSNGSLSSEKRLEDSLSKDPKMPTESKVKHNFYKRSKLLLKHFLDWENKTPTKKLLIVDLPSFLKKNLRFLSLEKKAGVHGA